MAFIKWDEKFRLNIIVIDEQHKRLFDLIENFYQGIQKKETTQAMSEILQGLTDYTTYHFHSEETLMTLHHYPSYQPHKTAHAKFIETIEDFRNRFQSGQLLIPIEIAEFLKDWLSNHILVTDHEFAPFLHQKGVT